MFFLVFADGWGKNEKMCRFYTLISEITKPPFFEATPNEHFFNKFTFFKGNRKTENSKKGVFTNLACAQLERKNF